MNLSVAVFSLISYDAVYSTLKIQFLMRCHDAAIEPHMCPKINSRMEFQIGHQFSILNYTVADFIPSIFTISRITMISQAIAGKKLWIKICLD